MNSRQLLVYENNLWARSSSLKSIISALTGSVCVCVYTCSERWQVCTGSDWYSTGASAIQTFILNLVSQHSVRIQQGYQVSALMDPSPHFQHWPMTSLPAETAQLPGMSPGVLQPTSSPSHVAAVNTRKQPHAHSTHTLSPFDLLFCSLFSATLQISLNVLYQSVSDWRPVAAVQTENMDCQQYWTLINLPTSSLSLPQVSFISLSRPEVTHGPLECQQQ